MKRYLVIIFMVLFVSTAFAKVEKASLNATGYDWLGYDKSEKTAFMGLFHAIYGIDNNRNAHTSLIKILDDFYYGAIKEAKANPMYVDENEFLKVRCIDVINKDLTKKGTSLKTNDIL